MGLNREKSAMPRPLLLHSPPAALRQEMEGTRFHHCTLVSAWLTVLTHKSGSPARVGAYETPVAYDPHPGANHSQIFEAYINSKIKIESSLAFATLFKCASRL